MSLIAVKKLRKPGTKRTCARCNEELDEELFYYTEAGYSAYCIDCHREYLRERRKTKRKIEYIPSSGVTRNHKEPEVTEVEWFYKSELADIAQSIHVGDRITSSGNIFVVVAVTGRFVTLENSKKVREAYLYDDMYKILKNKFKFRGEYDEES